MNTQVFLSAQEQSKITLHRNCHSAAQGCSRYCKCDISRQMYGILNHPRAFKIVQMRYIKVKIQHREPPQHSPHKGYKGSFGAKRYQKVLKSAKKSKKRPKMWQKVPRNAKKCKTRGTFIVFVLLFSHSKRFSVSRIRDIQKHFFTFARLLI